MSYKLPELGYSYDALEPHFDEQTMKIHHTLHHQTYVNNLNGVITNYASVANLPIEQLITKLSEVDAKDRTFVRNNAGGHANHGFFWKNLKKGTSPSGELQQAIDRDFGSFDQFKDQFGTAAKTVFGSGWAWLVASPDGSGKLSVVKTANQDSPLMGREVSGAEGIPILGVDVWEHAYYLKFQNRRPDYIGEFWNVVNWDFAAENYANAKST